MAKADRNSMEAGRKMVSRMFAEIVRTNSECDAGEPFSIFGKFRIRGRPQNNIVARYIDKAIKNGAGCLEGFCSALSDHVGRNGAEWPGVYGKMSDLEITAPRRTPARKVVDRGGESHRAH